MDDIASLEICVFCRYVHTLSLCGCRRGCLAIVICSAGLLLESESEVLKTTPAILCNRANCLPFSKAFWLNA